MFSRRMQTKKNVAYFEAVAENWKILRVLFSVNLCQSNNNMELT